MQINQNPNQPIFSDGDQSTWPTAPPSADVVLKPIEDVMRRKRFIFNSIIALTQKKITDLLIAARMH